MNKLKENTNQNKLAQNNTIQVVNVVESVINSIKNNFPENANYSINISNNKTVIKINDGVKGAVVTYEENGNFQRQEKVQYIKTTPDERLKQVEQLMGKKTQSEIASYLMVSQKTISNDIKKIKKNKKS
ncbi:MULTISPECIES: HTH domain-containing protein [unclassified Campylobacter]|uniref:HTH domain-containing protein n=1 Tax=unclassified Campylobacter TaxID=2593542 RepID=UPI001DFC7B97|nr:HTH domain-containing protein [Campylobacter sp. IFREMER_LSEM_CL2194]EGK7485904.1 HTH domain-containing protein [Campylobacter lari]EGK8077125.1 HTH domain-containing protein [Campylobacter lari]MCR8683753.1 HTH domain-containing protein [Campylobacter sp. LMG 17559]MCV3377687.1 HTH domain-containing protein [Campylobacter sp. IFREMER_LSEM_CL2194]